MNKVMIIIGLGLIASFSFVLASSTVTKQTSNKYEFGIKITEDYQTVENKIFHDIPIGLAVWSNHNRISNCSFIGCDDEGIVFFGNNNLVVNCVFYGCADGVELQNSFSNHFVDCRFFNCSHAGIDGIYENNNYNVMDNCLFVDNFMGAYFKDSYGNKYVDCQFLDNEFDEVKI